jgi:hypothetical protein
MAVGAAVLVTVGSFFAAQPILTRRPMRPRRSCSRFRHMANELTWLGHSAFRIDSPGGKRIYVDRSSKAIRVPDE